MKEEYTAEGIDIFDFSMVDNSGVLELLEGKLGLISSLNEECVRPQGKPTSFVYKLKMLHNDTKYLLVDRLQHQCEFGIKHFAGAVTYDASEFLKVSQLSCLWCSLYHKYHLSPLSIICLE